MHVPLISIIVYVYNAETSLKECLDSVFKQPHSSIEAICVNDGSVDDSKAVLTRYMEEDSRMRLLSMDRQGIAACRNAALNIATGDYVLFLDAHDSLHPDVLTECVERISGGDSYSCVAFNGVMKTSAGRRLEIISGYSEKNLPRTIDTLNNEYRALFINAALLFLPMAMLKEHTIRFNEKMHYEEFEFCARCFSLVDSIHWISKPMYFYTEGQRGSVAILPARHIDVFQVYRAAKSHFTDSGLWYTVEHLFYARYLVILLNIRQDSILPSNNATLIHKYETEFRAVINDVPKLILYSLLNFFERTGYGRRNLILGIRTDIERIIRKRSVRASSQGKIRTVIRSILMKVSPTYKAIHQTRELMYSLQKQMEELMSADKNNR